MFTGDPDLARARRLPLFAEASDASAARLFADAAAYDFAANSVLWRKGELPKHLHVLLTGLVGFKTTDRRANDYIVDFARPGEPIVLPPVILSRPYLFTAVTLVESRVMMLPAETFRMFLKTDATLSFAVNQLLCEQRIQLARHVESLKTRTPVERLASLLLSLTDRSSGEVEVSLPCERQMIAGWLGIVPSSASRIFRELEANYGIEGRGRQLRIRSIERLAECAGMSGGPTAAS